MRTRRFLALLVTTAAVSLSSLAVIQPAQAATEPSASGALSSSKVKRSDARACDAWTPTLEDVLDVMTYIVSDDGIATRSLRRTMHRYAKETRADATIARSSSLRADLRTAATEMDIWANDMRVLTAQPLLDSLREPLDTCSYL